MVLVIATRNIHKVREIQVILGPEHSCHAMSMFPDAPEIAEDADTFAGNASKKALELAQWLEDHPPALERLGGTGPVAVLADDSGLEVDALHGAPGVHSARFAALDGAAALGNTSDGENNAKLLRLLSRVPERKRTGRFRCVLALVPVTHGEERRPEPRLFEGACEGRITFEPKGTSGFGYDPLFVPEGFDSSFGELGDEVKHRLSHRGRALAGLKAHLGDAALAES